MRDVIYKTNFGFTSTDLLVCICECKCGATACSSQKILQVHPLAVMYQILLLVLDGMGENLLVELKNKLEGEESAILDKKTGDLFQSILQLVGCTPRQLPTMSPDMMDTEALLSPCTVGTLRMVQIRGRPNPKDLGNIATKAFR